MLQKSLNFQILLLTLFIASFASAQSRQIEQRRGESRKGERGNEGAMQEGNFSEREQFFYDRLTSGEIKNVEDIHRRGYASFASMDNRMAMKEESSATWQPIGAGLGGYASGRVRSIAFDPIDSNTVYVAAAVGGLWKTVDYTADSVVWQPLADNLPTLVCTSVVIPKQERLTIYLGTGETYPGYVASPGRGVFKSIDGGLNWTNILTSDLMGATCSEVAVDPNNASSIFVAAPGEFYDLITGHDTSNTYGFFHSTDAGVTWQKLSLAKKFHPVSISINAANSLNILVTGFYGEVFHTTDGGITWFASTPEYPGKVINPVLASSPAFPDVLYLSVTDSTFNSMSSLYQSLDSGLTWVEMSDAKVPGYGGYNNAVVIDPSDENHVFVGGIDSYESTDGGQTLTASSVWSDPPDRSTYSHADFHCLVYHNGLLFAGNDGGLSWYDGTSWYSGANANLPTIEFVGVDADQGFTYMVGGAQDNGTMASHITDPSFTFVLGGDGGNTWVSPLDGLTVYATYVRATLYRSNDGAASWQGGMYSNLITNTDLLKEDAPFYASYDASSDGSVIAFGGYHHIYVSPYSGSDGFQIQGAPTIDTPTCIRISRLDSNDMWAGTNGTVWRSANQGSYWNASKLGVSGQVVGIAIGNNDSIVYAVVAGLTKDSNAHFVKSTDGGVTWIKPATNFPMTPANSLARASSGQLFVGTDYGVITSTDDGVTWSQFGLGLPRVQVLSLKVKGNSDEFLLAGTHGRSAYWIPISPLGVQANSAKNIAVGECYPNPIISIASQHSQLSLTLQKPQVLKATLYDYLGHAVEVLTNGMTEQGTHDLHIPTSKLANGDYFIAIQIEGKALIRKLTVAR
jgi:photosystem II stability/assembly factor-like uncharacterized protein